MAGIELRQISKSFGDTLVLPRIGIDIRPGEFLTLVGPSGCGKSTLLRILAGLEQPDEGSVHIDGQDMTAVPPARRNLAMVFQSYALYPHLTVAQNMMTPLILRDLSARERLPVIGPLLSRGKRREIATRVHEAAETLQIEHLLGRKPGQLSGGQRQRVALGRAMVRAPKAFLMDEPLSNLDAALRVHMRAELSQLHRRLGTTFIYVTHDQTEALTMSDRMAVMKEGRILQLGTPDDIYRDPDTLDVARFIGSPRINLMAGEIVAGGAVTVMGHRLGLALPGPTGPVQIGLRPEHLHPEPGGPVEGQVLHLENLGSEVHVHLGVSEQEEPLIARVSPDEAHDLVLGASATFGIDPARVLVFNPDGSRRRALAPAPAPAPASVRETA
ncbi:Maltose/maltodextrin import ATP-binding protein MalK [Pseudoruegeria aquimaris]|uniref:Maltose/maltodextrin import ATP-binding protein MalK n=1 Tax=Pseudoruegeria aquimaris TaxID=393663 RepID=A0A1Y5RLV7_9RHOB|nr:ABC transporter ATP-binding protein [Pseudoruegeria aquimaris]SLN19429.1 Maltose/maltodextrin import ATP-binding protein MalK [Pseudoruegeria aquimaris]